MDPGLVFKALGDPTRSAIFSSLLERKHCMRSLSLKLGVSESAISQHMKLLRGADLVYGERFGHHVHYLPNHETLEELHAYCASLVSASLNLDRNTKTCNCAYRMSDK